jgi:hypothetical protein
MTWEQFSLLSVEEKGKIIAKEQAEIENKED